MLPPRPTSGAEYQMKGVELISILDAAKNTARRWLSAQQASADPANAAISVK